MDRQVWRSALEAGKYELLCCDGRENGGINGHLEAMQVDSAHLRARDRLQELKTDGSVSCSGSGTPQLISRSVARLAQALSHIELGIERRFLKAPLGEEDSKKEVKNKKNKKKEDDQASDDGSENERVPKTVLDRWRESLQSCSSLSQVFVHLSSLERSVRWSRSVLNARCRICRRKGDADNMLLCDGCDQGHHTHCLRPRLKSVPEGDWFCPDCRPKQRSSRVPSRQRSSINEEEADIEEEEKEENSEEEEEDSQEEEEESDEEDEEVVSMKKKSQAPPTKGKSQQATAKIQPNASKNTTYSSGKNSSASKSSRNKATPPSSKANAAAICKAAARSQPTVRLSRNILVPNGNTKTMPDLASPKLSKPRLPILPPSSSSCSSSRRSSGRNHGVHELSACEQLTVELVRHQDSWPFMKLVSRTQVTHTH
ncbi:hypothetical protein LDENG_00283690, partial [Lucifuga dentata]